MARKGRAARLASQRQAREAMRGIGEGQVVMQGRTGEVTQKWSRVFRYTPGRPEFAQGGAYIFLMRTNFR